MMAGDKWLETPLEPQIFYLLIFILLLIIFFLNKFLYTYKHLIALIRHLDLLDSLFAMLLANFSIYFVLFALNRFLFIAFALFLILEIYLTCFFMIYNSKECKKNVRKM